MTRKQAAEQEEARAKLREWIKPGDTVYTVLRHVSRSGMSRSIAAYVIKGNEPQWITWYAAKAIGSRFDEKHEGVHMGGCGMDMGFALVYELSYALFPEGFDCIGKAPDHRHWCPSNDHHNSGPGRDNYSPDNHHKEGGYALRHRWI